MNIQENKLSVSVPSIKLNEAQPMNTNTTTVTLLSQVIEQLKQADDGTVIQAYNDYAASNGYENIMDNDEDNVNTCFKSAYDAIQAAQYGDYNANHEYYILNGSANLVSFNYPTDDNSPIDYQELAQWIIDNESYSEYDLDIMTLDDLLASIEDNITDDEEMLFKLVNHLSVSYNVGNDLENITSDCMYELYNYDYEGLQEIVTLLGIN